MLSVLRKITLLFASAILFLFSTSCSKNEEQEQIIDYKLLLIGEWELTRETGSEYNRYGELSTWDDEYGEHTGSLIEKASFLESGIYIRTQQEFTDDKWSDPSLESRNYNLVDNIITIEAKSESDKPSKLIIKEINKNKMFLLMEYIENGKPGKNNLYYNRIK